MSIGRRGGTTGNRIMSPQLRGHNGGEYVETNYVCVYTGLYICHVILLNYYFVNWEFAFRENTVVNETP